MQYNFGWDPIKASENIRKHRVSFERAAQVFVDSETLSIFDEEHSENEERWATLGKDRNNVLLVVIHTFQEIDDGNVTIRIISARRATKREMQDYRER